MAKNYDFSGWATKNDIRCSDGRTIKRNAFKDNDGAKVPLVWNHDHNDAKAVIGHAMLENRDEGVYAYGSFNDTDLGQHVKQLVIHGDVTAMSIYANKLKQNGGDVIHGSIREVSLVLAGANPGAYIDNIISHGELSEEEAIIYSNDQVFELAHAEEGNSEKEHEELTHKEDSKMADEIKKETKKEGEKTIQDVIDTMNEEQKAVLFALVGKALEENGAEKKDETKEDNNMSHNVFDKETENTEGEVLSHSDFVEIVENAKKGNGSLRDAFNDKLNTLQHSVENIDYLFPEAKAVSATPATISRDMSWVAKLMAGVHHTPFSKVKSSAIDITADAARAKGYVKGRQKVEEVVTALKRKVSPQTIYKLQKLDRDDVLDIANEMDIVPYLKAEMRTMLEEELARAILIGDGRASSDNDKIFPTNVVPVLGDAAVYTTAKIVEREDGATDSAFFAGLIDEIIKAHKDYKGTGKGTFWAPDWVVTGMLLSKDTNGRYIYKDEAELAKVLRVAEIVTVEPMENLVRTDAEETFDYRCLGLILNPTDYNVGADKGGQTTMFEDFDLNVNKHEYLLETRVSGAIVKPFAAVSFELKSAHAGE